MNVLFDQGTPVPLRRHLHPHVVDTSAERGWSELQNGKLLDQAETARYDASARGTTLRPKHKARILTQPCGKAEVLRLQEWIDLATVGA